MSNQKYCDYIMKVLRQRLGLDENDTSKDERINEMSESRVFKEMCEWEGLIGYGSRLLDWVEDIYGIELNR